MIDTSYLKENLLLLNMSDKQADIYLCLLELGQAPVSVISRRTSIHRTSVYGYLQEMVQSGYVSSFTKQDIAYFATIDIDVIIRHYQQRLDTIEHNIPLFSQLASIYNKKPQIEHYEGLEGLKLLYQRILDNASTKEIVGFLSSDNMDTKLEEYLCQYNIPDRVNRQICAKILVPDTPGNDRYVSYPNSLKEIKYITYPLLENNPCEINIFGTDKVAIILYDSTIMNGIYIQNQALYNVLYSFFTMLWNK